MLQPRYNFAAVTVFKRIAVLGGSCPTIDLHDADAVLQYDPKVNPCLMLSTGMAALTSMLSAAGHVGVPKPVRCQGSHHRL